MGAVLCTAKEALVEKEAELFGLEWLGEVKDESGNWKDLEGWKEQYEPKKEKKEDSEQKKAAKQVIKDKALDLAFDKLQDELFKNLMKLMMEVSSLFLGKASESAKAEDMSKIMSSTNAIVLSYRFDQENSSRKFAFIREDACGVLTQVLHGILKEKAAPKASEDIRQIFEEQKTFIRSFLLQKLDLFVVSVDSRIGQQAQEVEGKLDEIKKQDVDTALEVVKDVVGEEKVEEARAQIKSEVTTRAGVQPTGSGPVFDKDLMKKKKDDIVAKFGGLLKELLLSKMEQLDQILKVYVDEFINALDDAMKVADKATEAKEKTEDELNEEMSLVVERLYVDANEAMSLEVENVLSMIKALVANSDGDDAEQ